MIAEALDQNGIAFDAADGMFDEDAHLAQGFVVRLLGRGQASVRLLPAFTRFLVWAFNLFTGIVGLQPQVTQVHQDGKANEPVEFRRQLCFEHLVVMMVAWKGVAQKDDHLLRGRNHGVLERMTFFYHCNAHAVVRRPAVVGRCVPWHQ